MKRTLLSWSSGKDSVWGLHVLRQQGEYEIVTLKVCQKKGTGHLNLLKQVIYRSFAGLESERVMLLAKNCDYTNNPVCEGNAASQARLAKSKTSQKIVCASIHFSEGAPLCGCLDRS
jgi:hypothetical protein